MLAFLCARFKVRGRENVPVQGPLLVISNHINLADPPLIAISLRRITIIMAKEELFHSRFLGYFVSRFGSFPVHRGQMDREALRQADQVLARGWALVMFPEGTRSPEAKLQPAFPGVALLAIRSGAPILPVGISGSENIKGAIWWLRRPRITVNIGTPFHLPPINGRVSREELIRHTDLMMRRIAELLPAEYRGDYKV
jgi:1-acyl-sn-glycerol-3-phosphate acyltransferase